MDNVFIVNIDGLRYQDGPAQGNARMPFFWDSLRAQGTLYTAFLNRGITITNAAHSTIVTGERHLTETSGKSAVVFRMTEAGTGQMDFP